MHGNARQRERQLQEQFGQDVLVRVVAYPRSKTLIYSFYCLRCVHEGVNPYEAFSSDKELTQDSDRARLPLVIAAYRRHQRDEHTKAVA